MELERGYKQTEAGVIPEDWDVDEIIRCADYVDYRGKTPTKASSGILLLTARNIRAGFIDYEASREYILSSEYESAMQRGRPRIGDVVITTEAPLGMVASLDRDDVALAQRVIKYRGKSGRLRSAFLKFYFLSFRFQSLLNENSSGSTAKGIKGSVLHRLPVILPPLSEQDSITEVLNDADALVNSLERLIAKKCNIRLGVMRELLTGERRVPGFSKEWESIQLGELFTFKNGLNKAKEFFGHGTPIVNYMDVFQSPAIYSSMLTGRVSLTNQELSAFDVRIGDVFFTRTSETVDEVGIASVILDAPNQTVFSGFLLRARPRHKKLCNNFKKYCFASDYVRKQIISRASYTTRALTNGRTLSAVNLHVPEPEEQLAIAEVLNDIDAEIAALKDKLVKARQLKQGMMQELLTGRTRLI